MTIFVQELKNITIKMVRFFLTASLLLAFTACGTDDGNDHPASPEDIEAKGFERIVADGNFDIYFTQANETSMQMRGGETSHVKASCDGKILRFYVAGGSHNDSDNVDIYVTSPKLRGITMNGSGDFESENPVNTDRIEIQVNNEGDVKLRSLDCNECNAKVTGSGDIDIDRISAKHLIAETTNEGAIDLQNANIDRAECTVRGDGDIDIDGHVGHCEKHILGTGTVDINP